MFEQIHEDLKKRMEEAKEIENVDFKIRFVEKAFYPLFSQNNNQPGWKLGLGDFVRHNEDSIIQVPLREDWIHNESDELSSKSKSIDFMKLGFDELKEFHWVKESTNPESSLEFLQDYIETELRMHGYIGPYVELDPNYIPGETSINRYRHLVIKNDYELNMKNFDFNRFMDELRDLFVNSGYNIGDESADIVLSEFRKNMEDGQTKTLIHQLETQYGFYDYEISVDDKLHIKRVLYSKGEGFNGDPYGNWGMIEHVNMFYNPENYEDKINAFADLVKPVIQEFNETNEFDDIFEDFDSDWIEEIQNQRIKTTEDGDIDFFYLADEMDKIDKKYWHDLTQKLIKDGVYDPEVD